MNSLHGKDVLVTGATGFLGRHLISRLCALGAEARALSCDLRDQEAVFEETADAKIIFHLGALNDAIHSLDHPSEHFSVNAQGTLNVLQGARQSGAEKVLLTSSAAVYGKLAGEGSLTEDHALVAHTPYAASKIAAEKVAESFFVAFDVPISVVRIFNAYGPGQSKNTVIARIINQCQSNQPELKLGNLAPRRDFVFSDDITEGLIRISLCEKANGEVLNLGSGDDCSIEEVANLAMEISGFSGRLISTNDNNRALSIDLDCIRSDMSKTSRLLNWKPRISLREGLGILLDKLK